MKIIFTLFLILIISSLSAQIPEWTLYTTIERVNCQITQDSINWVGTDTGLVRYNIVTNEYLIFNSNNSELPGNYVWSLAKNNNGTIFIGTKSGFATFDGFQWTAYTTANSDLPHNWVPAIDISPNGNIWIGTGMGLVSICDSVWSIYTTANSNLPNNYIRGLKTDENNII